MLLLGSPFISLPFSGATELPVDVTGEAVNSTVISVKWDHLRACRAGSHLSANNSVLNAIVEYTTVHQMKELFATTSEALLIGLNPFTNYTIKVAAVNESGDVGPYSYPITVQTHEDGNVIYVTDLYYFLHTSYSTRSSRWNHRDSICVSSEPDMGATTDA